MGRESGQVGEGGGGRGIGSWERGQVGEGRGREEMGEGYQGVWRHMHTVVTALTVLRLICFACPVPSLVLPGFSPPPSQPVSADDMPSTSRPVLR